MRKQVREHDIDTWATGFLDDLGTPTPITATTATRWSSSNS